MPKKLASEEHDLKPLLESPGPELPQKRLCSPGKANASCQQMEKSAGKGKSFGKNSSGPPRVGDGSWT